MGIVNPPNINNNFLVDEMTAIMTSSRPLLILVDNLEYPERAIVVMGTDANGCILHGARMNPTTVGFYQTNCTGLTCDQQSLIIGDVLMNCCACMQMNKTEQVLCVWDVLVLLPDGSVFSAPVCEQMVYEELCTFGATSGWHQGM